MEIASVLSPAENSPQPEPSQRPAIATNGEVFSDGTVIEFVRDPATSEPALLFWDGQTSSISKVMVYGGQTYVPSSIPRHFLEAINLPKCQTPYGSAQSLFSEISTILQDFTPLSEESASLISFFVLGSWLADMFSLAPCLFIVGPAESEARTLLRILYCLCRRALLLGELTCASFATLPFGLRPTLLAVQQELRPSLQKLLLISSVRGISVPRNGRLLDLYCSKAIYCPEVVPESNLRKGAIIIGIGPATTAFPVFDERAEQDLQERLASKLLGYRLANALRVKNSSFDVPRFPSCARELARTLGAAVEGDQELQAQLVGLLEQEDAAAKVDSWGLPESVLIESLLHYSHSAQDRVRVKELQVTANAIFLGRGEKLKLNDRAVGAHLKSLGFRTESLGNVGRGLFLTQPVRKRVHKLAKALNVRSIQDGIPRCEMCIEFLRVKGGNEGERSEHREHHSRLREAQ